MARLKIALLMMQKNESFLLEPWTRYHEAITDAGSIFLFDNGSSDPHVLSILAAAEERGVNVNREYCTHSDYMNCGSIFADWIQHLDAHNPHDFYFPLDCDEFLACRHQGSLSCDREVLDAVLTPLLNSRQVLTLPCKYVNSPYHPNRYSPETSCKKCFFAKGSCKHLGHGFHEAESQEGRAERTTEITYIDFHFRPYQECMRLSLQMVAPLLVNTSRRSIYDYSRTNRQNCHSAKALLQGEFTYYLHFLLQRDVVISNSLLDRFTALGIDHRPLFSSVNVYSFQRLLRLCLIDAWSRIWDEGVEIYYRTRLFLGRQKSRLREILGLSR